MARRTQLRSARPSAAAREAEIRSLLADLGAAVHTHTARVPYGGGGQGAVTDPAALSSQRTRAAFVASTTIEGPYQLAVTPAGSQVGVAMALGNDIGRPDGRTLLDLALERDAGALQGVGLSLDTAEALCRATASLVARAPAAPLADQPVLFFEAGGDEVAVTPLVSVRLLQQINARVAPVPAADRTRLVLPIAQGGSNPQNVAHYVNASPQREGEVLLNRNSRRGQYNALRARCPGGVRSPTERDLARIVATRSLAAACTPNRDAAQDFRSRAVVGLLVPGATVRLATIRAAERHHADVLARAFLTPLQAVRSHLRARGPGHGYALDRLTGAARAWLEHRAGMQDLAGVAAELGEDLIGKVERAARSALPAAARQALRAAMAAALADLA